MAPQQRLLFGGIDGDGAESVSHSASPCAEEPLDAIVYEAHPALMHQRAGEAFDPDYPYGPPAMYPRATHEPSALADAVARYGIFGGFVVTSMCCCFKRCSINSRCNCPMP